mgnify:CR=1 FL=1
MAVTSRDTLKQYCLRNLGAPVLEINVDDEQLEDRIDEALDYWRLYHNEGVEKMYLKQQMRCSSLYLTDAIADTFPVGVTVQGQTSGATAVVTNQSDIKSSDNNLLVTRVTGTFVASEDIATTEGETITATLLDDNFVVVREIDNRYIDLPDHVYGVSRMLPFSGTQTSKSMFDIQYQLRLNDLYDLTSTSIVYYKMVMSHLSLLDLELNGKPMFDFNRLQGRVYPRLEWNTNVIPGDYIVLECYRALDPATWTKVWDEPWLKRYVTSLFKKQWGVNIKKFGGIQLPGGVTLNGQAMYDEGFNEQKELEQELLTKQTPLEFFMG